MDIHGVWLVSHTRELLSMLPAQTGNPLPMPQQIGAKSAEWVERPPSSAYWRRELQTVSTASLHLFIYLFIYIVFLWFEVRASLG